MAIDCGEYYVLAGGGRWYKDTIHRHPNDLLIYKPINGDRHSDRGWYISIKYTKISWGTYSDYCSHISDALFYKKGDAVSARPIDHLDEYANATEALKFNAEKAVVKEKSMSRMLRPVIDEATAKLMKEEIIEKRSFPFAGSKPKKTDDALAKTLGHANWEKNAKKAEGRSKWYGVKTITVLDIPKGYRPVGVKAIRETDRAILFQRGEVTKWLPKSLLVFVGVVHEETCFAPSWLMNKAFKDKTGWL